LKSKIRREETEAEASKLLLLRMYIGDIIMVLWGYKSCFLLPTLEVVHMSYDELFEDDTDTGIKVMMIIVAFIIIVTIAWYARMLFVHPVMV
jgi:hypothetical protein